ncbi:hypothetical protein CVT26_005216 [Gymnopilus dilepis]|uniref:Uncharacterized protein n=1 Tax=Gymnopilus dilepis TaxID=231916 RepID=A0A409YVI2_9AGAR|nr:hypothetical protein CVT26_005216 [Gymnopilus dilepis]
MIAFVEGEVGGNLVPPLTLTLYISPPLGSTLSRGRQFRLASQDARYDVAAANAASSNTAGSGYPPSLSLPPPSTSPPSSMSSTTCPPPHSHIPLHPPRWCPRRDGAAAAASRGLLGNRAPRVSTHLEGSRLPPPLRALPP